MRDACRAALAELGVEQLVCVVHDRSLPGVAADLGCGSPGSRGARDFLEFLAGLGFTGVQLGPPGRITPANLSPYDGTVFSRSPLQLCWEALAAERPGLLDEAAYARAVGPAGDRCDYDRAFAGAEALWAALHRAVEGAEGPAAPVARALEAEAAAFEVRHAAWLEPDALHEALSRQFGTTDPRAWPDARLARAYGAGGEGVLAALRAAHPAALRRAAREQLLLHRQHADFRSAAHARGLSVVGDLQVGLSHADRWARASLLLEGYALGAPPSRTNPEGQPWGYPVLHPALFGTPDAPGPALQFVRARLGKLFDEYDGVRLDHPHGLVCPWVYREDPADPLAAVRAGARLYSAGARPGHAALAPYDIVRPDQVDGRLDPWADAYVAGLDAAQVSRYAVVLDALVAVARAAGRPRSSVVCEVLSTVPAPLAAVMERHGLGRFRVTQKADVTAPDDVYLPSAAEPPDWIMPATHDTPPLWDTCARWSTEVAAARLAYAVRRLAPDGAGAESLRAWFGASRARLAQAELALLFTGRARQVMVFVSDLLGETRVYNRPGTVHPDNWTLRVPPLFASLWDARARRAEAFDVAASLALALLAPSDPALRRGRAALVRRVLAASRAPLPPLDARMV